MNQTHFRRLTAAQTESAMLALALLMLVLLAGIAIVSRPITPIDETRYIGVAWEMWLRGDFLVPFKNGVPYSHKPPLMMWLFQAGWAVFGVNEWWPRLVSPLVSAGNLLLTIYLARRLWPNRVGIGGPSVLILVSCLLWTVFSTMAMFDIILALFALMGMHGALLAAEGRTRLGIALLGVAIGLGVLTKGPVILLHVLPVALLAPWWNPGLRWPRWFGGILVAVLIGAAIALLWAIPAGFAGGVEYRRAIFWGQTANRMVESVAHRHPVWWYLPLLPMMFFPWFVWPGLWRALSHSVKQGLDRGQRFCLVWMLVGIVVFSLISGKRMHYLIPIFPAFALFAARSVIDADRIKGLWLPVLVVLLISGGLLMGSTGWLIEGGTDVPEVWPSLLLMLVALVVYVVGQRFAKPMVILALLGVAVPVFVQLALFQFLYSSYDVLPIANAIHQVQNQGHVVAHLGKYHNQYHFAGRLQAPLSEIDEVADLESWLVNHPDAYAVVYTKNIGHLQEMTPIALQRYRGHTVALLNAQSARSFLAMPKVIENDKDGRVPGFGKNRAPINVNPF